MIIEPDRVSVFELWRSEKELEAFRGDGPGSDLAPLILRADVQQYIVAR